VDAADIVLGTDSIDLGPRLPTWLSRGNPPGGIGAEVDRSTEAAAGLTPIALCRSEVTS
jgi:hypothetical protein